VSRRHPPRSERDRWLDPPRRHRRVSPGAERQAAGRHAPRGAGSGVPERDGQGGDADRPRGADV